MSNVLTKLEDHAGLTGTQAAMLLGVPRPTYYGWRRVDVPPLWITRHAEALVRLPSTTLRALINEHVHGNEL